MTNEAPSTATEAIELLRAEGYTADYQLVQGQLRAPDVEASDIESVEVHKVYRFEGPSDPGDLMIVMALHDPSTGAKGTMASAYGPAADPETADYLVALEDRFKG